MYYFEHLSRLSPHKRSEIADFLQGNDLRLDEQIHDWVLGYDEQGQLVACGGLCYQIMKCVAIDPACRGEGMALQLVTQLTHLAYEQGKTHLFIYTKPDYTALFQACGFYLISDALPDVVLLENSRHRLAMQCEAWRQLAVVGNKIGAIVMNANPFTLGHRYLIEQALGQCDHLHLFVVGENASQFSYAERFNLVQQGIADLGRITLHGGSDYVISRATFPDYFIKDRGITDRLYVEIDLKLFRRRIAPSLGITHRFVGTEPICGVTRAYNQQMHHWLSTPELVAPIIEVVEIERKPCDSEPISASRVRALLAERRWRELAAFVPATTLNYLKQREGKSE